MKEVTERVDRLLTTTVPVKLADGVSVHPNITSVSPRKYLYVKDDLRWYARLLDCVRCHVLLRLCRSPRSARGHEEQARRLRGVAHSRPNTIPKCPKRWPYA